MAEACNRLIKNRIMCWNYLDLARQLEKAPDNEASAPSPTFATGFL